MPKKPIFPKFSVRATDGQAYVSVAGRRTYLGRYDSTAAKRRYQKICHRITAGIEPRLAVQFEDDGEVDELIADYLDHAKEYYARGAEPTSEYGSMRWALEPLSRYFGDMAPDQFGPRDLVKLREILVASGRVRSGVNATISRVKKFWRWCCENELCEPGLYHRLTCVRGLRRGQGNCAEAEPVHAACPASVAAVLPFLPPTVAAMVRVQYLCGMRPGEVCIMRRCDLLEGGDIWLYQPSVHKNEWRSQSLVKAIPRVAQSILDEYLSDDPQAYLFRPAESYEHAKRTRLANAPPRATPRYPSEDRRLAKERANRARRAGREFSPHYTVPSYRQALSRGFDKAVAVGLDLEPFTPNQLRHTSLTDVMDLLDEKSAQQWAGHRSASATRIYTQKQLEARATELIAIARQLDAAWAAKSA